MNIDQELLRRTAAFALAEDLGLPPSTRFDPGALSRDCTTATLGPAVETPDEARIVARADGVVAGLNLAAETFALLDDHAAFEPRVGVGERCAAGQEVARVRARTAVLLAGERVALNFLQRLSGVATRTRRFVDAVAGTRARILDTRKTTPGLRAFERAAVRAGGGENHRDGLYDQVLLKENHFALAGGSYEEVVRAAVAGNRARRPVIAEARDVTEAVAAVRGGAGVVLLDNFGHGQELRAAVEAVRDAAREAGRDVAVEASGGITLDTVRAVAEAGVDRISVGSLTHSAPALDLSMLVETAVRHGGREVHP